MCVTVAALQPNVLVVDTGAGSDSVTSVTSGGPGLANHDAVRTGEGEDAVTWSDPMGPDSALDGGGDDRDTLIMSASGETFGVALVAQTFTRNGRREASFRSFEDFLVAPEPGPGAWPRSPASGRWRSVAPTARTSLTSCLP